MPPVKAKRVGPLIVVNNSALEKRHLELAEHEEAMLQAHQKSVAAYKSQTIAAHKEAQEAHNAAAHHLGKAGWAMESAKHYEYAKEHETFSATVQDMSTEAMSKRNESVLTFLTTAATKARSIEPAFVAMVSAAVKDKPKPTQEETIFAGLVSGRNGKPAARS
jgi:hypothetical protein